MRDQDTLQAAGSKKCKKSFNAGPKVQENVSFRTRSIAWNSIARLPQFCVIRRWRGCSHSHNGERFYNGLGDSFGDPQVEDLPLRARLLRIEPTIFLKRFKV